MAWRDTVLATADRIGMGDRARKLRLALGPAEWRRDVADHQRLRMLIMLTLDEDGTFVDVGAHSGNILRDAVRVAPLGRHVAIEPLPEYAAKLRAEFPTVVVHQVAASNSVGTISFNFHPDHPEWSGMQEQEYPSDARPERITVRKARIDDLLDGFPPPQMIKIDVEGAEREAIEGAMKTIRTHQPLIAFEHHSAALRFGTEPAHIYDLLAGDGGLRIFDLDGDGPYDLAQFTSAHAEGRLINFIAHR